MASTLPLPTTTSTVLPVDVGQDAAARVYVRVLCMW